MLLKAKSREACGVLSKSCLRDLFGIHYMGVLLDCSSQVPARAAFSGCDAGHASDSRACGDRNFSARCDSAEWGAAAGKAFCVDAAGWGDGDPAVSVYHRCVNRRAGRMDRWAGNHCGRVLGGRSRSGAAGESQKFPACCGGAPSLRGIFSDRARGVGAGGHRDGTIVSCSA